MQPIRIGAPFREGPSTFSEGVHFNFTVSGCSLVLSVRDPDRSYTQEMQTGDVTLGLGGVDQALLVFSKFGVLPWRIAHYNWWINPPVVRPDPFAEPETFRGTGVIAAALVDAETGIVKALRSVRPPEEFTGLFLYAVEMQIRSQFDPWSYLDVVQEALKSPGEEERLVKDAAFMGLCPRTAGSGAEHGRSGQVLWDLGGYGETVPEA